MSGKGTNGGTRIIRVDTLARVEGEGALLVKLKDGQVSDVQLKIFEPPRLFEAFLQGRHYAEVVDIVARICGICPIAYQMTAVHAIERAFGFEAAPAVRLLRRLFYCGEWIASHALHVFMLHMPDFLGYPDAIRMAGAHRALVERGLRIKKAGNAVMALLGGREIHPVSVAVGGFYRVPTEAELRPLMEELAWAEAAAIETARFAAGLRFPEFEQDYDFVALAHPEAYPIDEGRISSNRGLSIDAAAFEQEFSEHQVAYSTALRASLRGHGAYMVGSLARFNLNFERLPPALQSLARACGAEPPCRNPFRSIVVRSIEIAYACGEALRLIAAYRAPAAARGEVEPRAGTGWAATEAPRGLLYHRFDIDERGLIRAARIVPPTSQNQKRIEDDLWHFVPQVARRPLQEVTLQCEQAVRNYDPCISCSTHFLKLTVEHE